MKFYFCRRNIPDISGEALKSCRFDPNNDPLCPIFQLKTIVDGTNAEPFGEIAIKVTVLLTGVSQ